MRDLTGISFGVQALSWCAALTTPDEAAARLLGASQAVWRTSGAKVDETNAYGAFDQRSQEHVREALGPERYAQAFSEGAALSFEQAVSLALGEDADAEDADGAAVVSRLGVPSAAGGLTRREREIAGLLTEGLSNKEIAARLVISQRTVETHVDHVLGKLGITSRAQVASWVAEQQAR
jgi:DNA-binding NarL/FixJ family response regulator